MPLADRTRALLATGLSLSARELACHLDCHENAARNCLLVLLRRGEVQRRTGCQPYRYEVSA